MLLPFTIILILWKWPLPQYRWQQPFLFHHPYFLIGDKTGNRRVPGIDKQGWCGQPGDNISPGWSQSISTTYMIYIVQPWCDAYMRWLLLDLLWIIFISRFRDNTSFRWCNTSLSRDSFSFSRDDISLLPEVQILGIAPNVYRQDILCPRENVS